MSDEPFETPCPAPVHVPAFELPVSAALSPQTRAMMAQPIDLPAVAIPAPFKFDREDDYRDAVELFRESLDDRFTRPLSDMLVAQFPTERTSRSIAGVPVEDFVPEGADPERVLINMHGGAFCSGAIFVGRIESAPMACRSGLRVVSVDYRQGYEHKYPAATEDVVAVYKELLKTYAPGRIGIYGGSAGAMLAGQVTAWLIYNGLPVPGAVGMFGAGFGGPGDGDYFAAIASGQPPPDSLMSRFLDGEVGYFSTTSPNDPLANPNVAPIELRAKFPPTLLITGTRAFDLSPVIGTHRALVQAGVDAQLHVFDGLGHCFYYFAGTPESDDAYDTMVRFFRKHLNG
jgi:monoterpene epsilon-lactone hydrolase